MAVSTEQYQAILARLVAIEEMLNDIVVASQHYITRSQVQQLTTLLQTEISSLSSDVDAVEARVTTIENEPLT